MQNTRRSFLGWLGLSAAAIPVAVEAAKGTASVEHLKHDWVGTFPSKEMLDAQREINRLHSLTTVAPTGIWGNWPYEGAQRFVEVPREPNDPSWLAHRSRVEVYKNGEWTEA